MPHHSFKLPPIDVDMWNMAVRRFKPRAARGPDGFAKEDLVNMPPSFAQELINMFHSLEQRELMTLANLGQSLSFPCSSDVGLASEPDKC